MAIKRPDTPLANTPEPTITYTTPRNKSYSTYEGEGDKSGYLKVTRPNGSTRTITNPKKAERKIARVVKRNTVNGELKGEIK